MSKNNPRNMPSVIEDAVLTPLNKPAKAAARRPRRTSKMVNGVRRTDPYVPVGHPDFVWTTGADVQRTWRKYGWTPPSEQMTPPPAPAIGGTPAWAMMVRRIK